MRPSGTRFSKRRPRFARLRVGQAPAQFRRYPRGRTFGKCGVPRVPCGHLHGAARFYEPRHICGLEIPPGRAEPKQIVIYALLSHQGMDASPLAVKPTRVLRGDGTVVAVSVSGLYEQLHSVPQGYASCLNHPPVIKFCRPCAVQLGGTLCCRWPKGWSPRQLPATLTPLHRP